MRMVLAQLFGEACANPGTVGWLSAGAPLCVTKDGSTTQTGGIVFADLPANLFGSFLMGLFQDGTVLGLAVPIAISWLPAQHPFQKATLLYVAFKTGFCGSLTTFSSWNSEMVVLIFGTPFKSQIWKAIFGYIVGMETSLGSFVCGCALARYLHRFACPLLAAEAEACHIKREQGVYLNRQLPDFERRFLAQLDLHGATGAAELYPVARMDGLERWRASTVEARRVGSLLLPTLVEIETALWVEHRPIPPQAESIARSLGWEVDSLLLYVAEKDTDMHSLPSVHSSASRTIKVDHLDIYDAQYMQLPMVATVLSIIMILLLLGLILVNSGSATAVTNRTMFYAMLLAPTGALLRWSLSGWNGTFSLLPPTWRWLPVGTLTANVVGCVVSIVCIALEYRLQNNLSFDATNFWVIGSLRAVKVGFAGCLTTVSTFVAEVSGFMQSRNNHAYPYIWISLCTSCVLGSFLYGCIVYLF
jgi:fluoride ion exporter CrcB/FEX